MCSVNSDKQPGSNTENKRPDHNIPRDNITKTKRSEPKNTRRPVKKKQTKMTIVYTNTRGITGKMKSLKGVVEELNPQIMAISETKLNTDKNVIVDGYKWIGRPREGKQGGGIGILVQDEIRKHTNIHKIEQGDIEIMWITIRHRGNRPMTIGLYYGKQESRTSRDEAEQEIEKIKQDIQELTEKGHYILIVGDFNAKLIDNISRDGRIIDEKIIKECNMKMMNESHKCQGKYTRVNTAITTEKSIIDYIFADENLEKAIQNVIIDEEGKYKITGRKPSDHNTIVINIELPRETTPINKNREMETGKDPLNISKKTNWTMYRTRLTEAELGKIIEKTNNKYNKLEQEIWRVAEEVIKIRKKRKHKRPGNKEIRTARQERKEAKNKYNNAIKTKNPISIMRTKQEYQAKQKKAKELIEIEHATEVQNTIEKMTRGNGEDRDLLWKIRRKLGKSDVEEFTYIKYLTKYLSFTEGQAGGRKGRATTDQLFILKSIMKKTKIAKKRLYITFLDIEKAYDKTWQEGVLHLIWNRGIKGKYGE